MNITLTDKAKNYLEKKNMRTVTIDLFVAGCCIEIGEPTVTAGQPIEKPEKFDKFQTEGYTIYLFKGADVRSSGLVINLKNFLGIKTLDVTGIKLM